MIISLSGAQGTGKSSCLNSLRELGYKTVDVKTSRSILKEWNTTLHDVNKDHATTQRFQDEILRRHYDSIKDKIDSKEVYIQERSFADIFAYGINILGPFNEYNDYMSQYYIDCKQAQAAYKHVFYLSNRPSNTVLDDGVRSTGRHFCTMMDNVIKTFVDEFKPIKDGTYNNVTYIDTVNHDERMNGILRVIETINGWWKGSV